MKVKEKALAVVNTLEYIWPGRVWTWTVPEIVDHTEVTLDFECEDLELEFVVDNFSSTCTLKVRHGPTFQHSGPEMYQLIESVKTDHLKWEANKSTAPCTFESSSNPTKKIDSSPNLEKFLQETWPRAEWRLNCISSKELRFISKSGLCLKVWKPIDGEYAVSMSKEFKSSMTELCVFTGPELASLVFKSVRESVEVLTKTVESCMSGLEELLDLRNT